MTATQKAPDAEHTSLQAALLAFQAECPTLRKDATNPHFRSKFTPLDTIVETVGPLLTKHGLTWSTFPTRDENGPALRYMLGHAASGESLTGTMPLLLTKADPQGQGSAITYARRYSMCAVLNLVADEDDDGNAGSSGNARQQAAKPKPKPVPAEVADSLIAGIKSLGLTRGQIRTQLTAAGAGNVPQDADLEAVVRGLSPEQAQALAGQLTDLGTARVAQEAGA